MVIVESAEPDFSPSPGQVIITAKSSPSVKAPPSVASVKASVAPSDGLVPFLPVISPIATPSGSFQPLVKIELSAGGVKAVEDNASPDGAGATGKFKKVKPGKYLMRVKSDVMSAPIEERPITVDGERSETIIMGAVTFSIPKLREDDVTRAIEVTIRQEPSRKVMLKDTLAHLEAHGLVGEVHPRTVLLPYGKYSWAVADVSTDSTLGFVGVPKNTPPMITTSTSFELDDTHPVVNLALEGIIRTKNVE